MARKLLNIVVLTLVLGVGNGQWLSANCCF